MKKLLLLFTVLFCFVSAKAQDNPFAEYGYKPKVATFSQGQFNESFDNDTIVQIGSILFNTKSRQIVAFVEYDTLCSEATLEPDIVSRWLSPDPLASQFPSWSPYTAFNNNPIYFTDPDGKAVKPVNEDAEKLVSATIKRFGGAAFASAIKLSVSRESGNIRSDMLPQNQSFEDANDFRKALKSEGFKLEKSQAEDAFTFFKKLSDPNVTELAVFSKSQGASTTVPGSMGTSLAEGENPTTNENFKVFHENFFKDSRILDQLTKEKDFGVLPFKAEIPSDPDISHRGTIVIDATGKENADESVDAFIESIK